MSTEKYTLARVMELLGYKKSDKKIELAQKKSEDGETTFDSESFAIGDAVFIVTEDGQIPVPEGTYILEDASVISVDTSGTIVEVKEAGAEVAEEELQNAPMKEETGKPVAQALPTTIIESMVKETRFAKSKLEETPKQETKLSAKFAALVYEATPVEITPEVAATIAEEIAKAVVEIAETEEGAELINEYKKMNQTKLSADNSLEVRLTKLEEENTALKERLRNEESNRTKVNPEHQTEQRQFFKLGARREESIQDRVMQSLFN